jgi:hypothetical protein
MRQFAMLVVFRANRGDSIPPRLLPIATGFDLGWAQNWAQPFIVRFVESLVLSEEELSASDASLPAC